MSSLWHRFWHVDPSAQPSSQAERDASLWTPAAIAETQHQLWSHAGEAFHLWWRFWAGFWPRLPSLPPAGVLEPPQPPAPMPLVAPDAPLPPTRRHPASTARKASSRRAGARAGGTTRPARPTRGD